MKKRIAALLLVLASVMTGIASGEQMADYAPGDQLHGFTLTQEKEMISPPALMRLWVHDQTGAQVYFFENDDPNRTFSIAFRTEPSDNTGKLHILEHAVCAASEKYPGQDVFFDAIAQAYITDLNAATYKSATNYYVSSMSEDQLERMTDLYLDCAFHSALRSEPNFFYREGWRYTMEDKDAPLTIDGIVYNEMKGLYGDIYTQHYYQGIDRALFPDTYQQWESGGIPDVIPELTYEELIAFYDACYHPSNSISMFYGDVETARYLKLLDEEYFSSFEAQPSAGYSPAQTPFEEMVVYAQDFPVSAQSGQTGGIISYATALPEGTPFVEILALSAGLECLDDESSVLMESLHATGIGASYWTEYYLCGTQLVICICADEADTTRAEEFKDVITASLRTTLQKGLDREMLASIFDEMALQNALVSNQSGVGVMMASRLAQVIDSNYVELLDQSAYLPEAKAFCEQRRLEDLMEKHILNNSHAALVTTTPKAGLQEEREEAQTRALAQKKAAMAPQEIEQIVENTASFRRWNQEGGSNPETLRKLRTETPENVNAILPVYESAVVQANGAVLYSADVHGEAVYCEYIFDLSHLSIEELRTLDVYLELMGSDTEKRSMRDISIAKRSLLTELSSDLHAETRADGSVYPALSISFYTLDAHLEEAAALVMEMLCETDLVSCAPYFSAAISAKTQNYYDTEKLTTTVAHDAAMAGSSVQAALDYAIFNLDDYAYLTRLGTMSEESIAAMLASVRDKALVREGASVIAIGNAEGRQARGEKLCALLPEAALPLEAGDWKQAILGQKSAATGFRSSTNSVYVRSVFDMASLGIETTGDLRLLGDIIQDVFLLPELRYQLGAYSASMSMNEKNRYLFYLYRAPSFSGVLERIRELPSEMEQVLSEMTQDELAGYQLSRISSETQPQGAWKEAAAQLHNLRHGMDSQKLQTILDQICAATTQSLSAALPKLHRIIEAAGFAVIAPGSVIDENAALFDTVVQLP